MEVVVKGLGHVVHALDPVSGSPFGADLWKLTEEDAKAIAEPATRIANRYATLRGAAGFSDEIGVGAALFPYVKRNLSERGRIKAAHEQLGRADRHAPAYQPETASQPGSREAEPNIQPGSQPASQPYSEPEVRLAATAGSGEPEQAPKAGVADAFEFAAGGGSPMRVPPHEVSDSKAQGDQAA